VACAPHPAYLASAECATLRRSTPSCGSGAAVRRSIREHCIEPSSRHADELLDERLAHRGRVSDRDRIVCTTEKAPRIEPVQRASSKIDQFFLGRITDGRKFVS
jgi:hypothetical protein